MYFSPTAVTVFSCNGCLVLTNIFGWCYNVHCWLKAIIKWINYCNLLGKYRQGSLKDMHTPVYTHTHTHTHTYHMPLVRNWLISLSTCALMKECFSVLQGAKDNGGMYFKASLEMKHLLKPQDDNCDNNHDNCLLSMTF